MRSRLDLQSMLEKLLGTRNVYFQPPESLILKYPCIVYKLSKSDHVYADNKIYIHGTKYSVTVIDKNPDSEIVKKICDLPCCSFDRFYTSDNLNHTTFTLYW